jgi:5-methylcytosine-specific restriction endonuclease McrA
MSGWNGSRVRTARKRIAAQLPAPCWRCGRILDTDDPWTVGHIIDRAIAPHLADDPNNQAPECQYCNSSAGATAGNRRRNHRRPAMAPTSRTW